LKPWETCPFHAHEDDSRIANGGTDTWRIMAAVRLRDKLIENGLSRFEPDPVQALKAKGRR
jgi:hypothetical protein